MDDIQQETAASDSPRQSRQEKRPGKVLWIAGAVLALLALGFCGMFGLMLMYAGSFEGFGSQVALIRIEGVIAGGEGGSGVLGGRVTSPEQVIKLLKQAEEDSRVKAILLRINSPGGSAAAGQEIYEAVRRVRKEKPVVASISDQGASAAYMIASAADKIVANPASLVGSIGVIMEVTNYEELLDKLGVKFITITQGKYKDIGNPARPMKPEERKFLQEQTRIVYEQFIEDVAEGRGMDKKEVERLATGLFWVGTEAKKLGLVDEIGNYEDAVRIAGELGDIEGEPHVVEMGEPDLWDLVDEFVSSRLRRVFGGAPTLQDRSSVRVR